MKKHYHIHKTAATPHITEQDLELLAADLDHHAKAKLKDGCLGGKLSGYEPDIRQTAINPAQK